jgi:elongation factor Ts
MADDNGKAEFNAKDVQRLRQATGVGMMDAKQALEACHGDFEAAVEWLRVHGKMSNLKRSDREATEGAVAAVRDGSVAALVQLRSETDFVAKAPEFVALVDEIAARVAADGTDVVDQFEGEIDRLRATLKENLSVGAVARLEAADGQVVDTYLHQQAGRGVNAVAIVLEGGSEELAHEIAVHIAFTRPTYLSRDEVPDADLDKERAIIEETARNEGKPDAALPKIAEGRLNAWIKERVLLEQSYVRDEKQSITELLGKAKIIRFSQVVIGS